MFRRALLNLWEHCGLAVRDPVPVIPAERARSVLGESVAVALAVRSPQKGRDDLEIPLRDPAGLAPEIGQPEVDV